MTRISRDAYGLKLAEAAALRADCTRRQVGAVVIAADGSIVSTGYNGLAAGLPGCASAVACPRGQLSYEEQPADVDYSATGCRAVHAEVNAILRGRGREGCKGATIYVTDEPCFHCSVVIEGAGIVRVVIAAKDDEPKTWTYPGEVTRILVPAKGTDELLAAMYADPEHPLRKAADAKRVPATAPSPSDAAPAATITQIPSEPPVKQGDPDPTGGGPFCTEAVPVGGFACTLEAGHSGGWHISGDGDEVLAVWPTATPTTEPAWGATSADWDAIEAEAPELLGSVSNAAVAPTIKVRLGDGDPVDGKLVGTTLVLPASVSNADRVVVAPANPIMTGPGSFVLWPTEEQRAAVSNAEREPLTVPGPPHAPEAALAPEPGWLAALRRQEERVAAHRATAARRADLAERYEGWKA